MAKNITMQPADILNLTCDHPATPVSGSPVRAGYITGTALENEAADGTTVTFVGKHVAHITVKGTDGANATAISVGDKLYYDDAGTPTINKNASGKFFGYALAAVGSNNNGTIDVLHVLGA